MWLLSFGSRLQEAASSSCESLESFEGVFGGGGLAVGQTVRVRPLRCSEGADILGTFKEPDGAGLCNSEIFRGLPGS